MVAKLPSLHRAGCDARMPGAMDFSNIEDHVVALEQVEGATQLRRSI
jgi:hypothetical protein